MRKADPGATPGDSPDDSAKFGTPRRRNCQCMWMRLCPGVQTPTESVPKRATQTGCWPILGRRNKSGTRRVTEAPCSVARTGARDERTVLVYLRDIIPGPTSSLSRRIEQQGITEVRVSFQESDTGDFARKRAFVPQDI